MTLQTHILKCPVEVRTLILSNLTSNTDKRAMTLVNRYLGSVAQASIYRHIDMAWVCNNPPPLRLIARTLLDRPDLASMVRSIRLDGHGIYNSLSSDVELGSVPTLDRTRIIDVIGQNEEATEWAKHIERGTLGAVVAFLIALTPNISGVYLGIDFCIHIKWFTLLFRLRGVQKIPIFGSLTKFTISHLGQSHGRHGFDLHSCFLSIFRLPQLMEISIATGPRRTLPWGSLQIPSVMSNLTSLSLCARPDQQLEKVLTFAPNLTKLKWTYAKDTNTSSVLNVRLNILGAFLRPLRFRLRELVLYIDEFRNTSVGIDPLAGLLSLQDFDALRSLTISFCCLEGMGSRTTITRPLELILPLNLVSLTLSAELGWRDDYEWTCEAVTGLIVSLLNSQCHKTAKLQSLLIAGEIWPHYGRGEVQDTEEFKELQGYALRAGVDLQAQGETASEGDQEQAIDQWIARYGNILPHTR